MTSAFKTYKFKLEPNHGQEQQFRQWLGTTRYVYNTALQLKKWVYSSCHKSVSKNDIQKELTIIRA